MPEPTYQPCSHECNGCPACDPALTPTEPAARALSEAEWEAVRDDFGAVERVAVEHYAAGLRDGAVEALTEVERRIESAGAAAVKRSTDWFNEGARRGAWGTAAEIVRDYREEVR